MTEEGAAELGRGKRTHEELESQLEPTPVEKANSEATTIMETTRLQLRFMDIDDCLAEWTVCMDLDQNESIAAVKYQVWCLRNLCTAANMLVEEIRLTWGTRELVDAFLIGDYPFGDGDFVQVTSKEVSNVDSHEHIDEF